MISISTLVATTKSQAVSLRRGAIAHSSCKIDIDLYAAIGNCYTAVVSRPLALVSLGLLVCASAFAQIFDVELRGTWFKRGDDWCVRIEVPAPRVSMDRLRIEARDVNTSEPLRFHIDARGSRRRAAIIELRFAIENPRDVSLYIRGLDIRDSSGRELVYNPQLIVPPPPGEAAEYPRAPAPGSAFRGPAGGAAPPEPPPTFSGQGAPPPVPFNAPTITNPSRSLAASDTTPPPKKDGNAQIDIPQFPFPPPRYSTAEKVPRNLLVTGNSNPRLKDVEASLTKAFERCGYGDKSFYAVPDGFAMASRLEQINADGTPGAERWSLDVTPVRRFSVRDYLKALFEARPGHYRVVVFVVTNHPFKQKDATVKSKEASAWVREGMNTLPREIGDREFSNDYVCTALIYEFKSVGGGEATFVEPSELTARDHLERSGLLAALQPPPM